MTKPYRELVGVQATFSKTKETYKLSHFYRWQSGDWQSGGLMIEGYDMDRAEPAEDIAESLRKAYAPVTLRIWKHDAAAEQAELLQLDEGADPNQLGLLGTWTLYAEL